MRLKTAFLLTLLCASQATSQTAALPLESIKVEGSGIPQPVILEIAALRLSSPINKSGIEQACQRLQESGLFSSVSYRCAPTASKGYALTLSLADQGPLIAATIDVPGADEEETWRWLATRFRIFDHQIPQDGAAQTYLAGEIERHLGSRMRGQHLILRTDWEIKTGKVGLSFQPEMLPSIQDFTFTGNQEVTSDELASVLKPILANVGYSERRFASAIELNLRPVYEQHGYYRVKFAPSGPQWVGEGVALSVAITEGSPYRLGKVNLLGDALPVDAMLSAAKFPNGKLANWKQIQDGIWEMERVVKRTGFLEATASADRSYDDAAHLLDLGIRVNKGPLYRFGELRISGLDPKLTARAKEVWKLKAGDPYDYAYPNDFFEAFSRTVDLRNFRKYGAPAQKGAGDHVMDINLVFEPR